MRTLAKIHNGNPTRSLSSWMDDWFSRDFNTLVSDNARWTTPSVNIKETEDHFALEVAAPGLKKSDFNIELDNGLLTISSEKKVEDTQEEGQYTRREYSFQSFKRTFTLPDSVDAASVSAAYEDGILNVVLPKKEEAKTQPPKTIEIK